MLIEQGRDQLLVRQIVLGHEDSQDACGVAEDDATVSCAARGAPSMAAANAVTIASSSSDCLTGLTSVAANSRGASSTERR